MDEQSEYTTYYIPENIPRGLSIGGKNISKVQLRDIVVLVLLGVALQFLIPVPEFRFRIVLVLVSAAPGFIFGWVGYNGFAPSVAFQAWIEYMQTRQTRIYDPTPYLLIADPIDVETEKVTVIDKAIDYLDEQKKRIRERKENESYVEGENFQFGANRQIAAYVNASQAAELRAARQERITETAAATSDESKIPLMEQGIKLNEYPAEPMEKTQHEEENAAEAPAEPQGSFLDFVEPNAHRKGKN